ncbi:FtsX-like permease family protein [Opitutales bacterium]|nr:FtsX-like permease family protein [Opitutales bacterium]
MRIWRIVFANLKYSKRQHLGTCLGAALASMILVGALTVGDSVRATLSYQSLERIGKITHLFISEDGYFHADLANRMQAGWEGNESAQFAPVLMTQGTLASPDGKVRASGVQVLGIDDRFFDFAKDPSQSPDLEQQNFWVSPDLAHELGVNVGTRMILRVEEPSLFSRDAPLSGERDARFVSWNRPFGGVLNSSQLGKFSLRASMEPVRTIFAPLSLLQEDMFVNFDPVGERTDFANLLVVLTNEPQNILEENMERAWTLSDAGLEIKKLKSNDTWSLRTRSVFLSDSIVNRAEEINPDLQGEFTYLVNAIRKPVRGQDLNTSMIPYSMVCGVDSGVEGLFSADWKDDQIALNQWAANDLNLSLGDQVTLEYYTVGERRELLQSTHSFEVGKILPMPKKIDSGQESDWTPRFPGLSDAENCGEWDTGIPIKYKIRPKDEKYWDDFRGSPKAFVSLLAAQEMWGNRWGKHTGLRAIGKGAAQRLQIDLQEKLRSADSGLRIIQLKNDAKNAVSGPVDFSQLFLAFGFFVILAGVSLSAMLFGFSMEQRNRQVGLFFALGYSSMQVKLLTWTEAGVVCLLGSLMGLGWAWFFGKGILWMLGGSWGGAVSNLQIIYAPTAQSIGIGALASFCMGLFTLAWVSRKQSRQAPVALLNGREFMVPYSNFEIKKKEWGRWFLFSIWTTAILLSIFGWLHQLPMGPTFFGVGALVLTAGLGEYFRFHRSTKHNVGEPKFLLQLDRRIGRKLTVVGILAVGSFLVIGAGAFRQKAAEDCSKLDSGTGGFSYILKTTLPLYDDLLGTEAEALFDLDPDIMGGVSLVSIRAQDGDDASCLNLNQAQIPPLYGVPLKQMKGRFEFVEGNWSALSKPIADGVYPALVDQNTLMWALKKKVGDQIPYTNGEGKTFKVQIEAVVKGSFLQGSLYFAEEHWIKHFPGRGGYQNFWIDVKNNRPQIVLNHLKDRLFNYGPETQSTQERLNRLRAVENTYLSIFQFLGGLGVILGTVGLLIVIMRNLCERREEYSILSAVGYSVVHLRELAWKENLSLVIWGLSIGCGAGLFGVLPAMWSGSGNFSLGGVLVFGITLLFLAAFFVSLAIRIGLKQDKIKLLSRE